MIPTARQTLTGLVAMFAALPLAAQATPPDRVQLIRVVARDYVYDAPTTVPAGIATLQLVNQGADVHQVTIQELPEGHTVKEFFDATRNSGRAPAWSRMVAQTTTIANGGEALVAFRMAPGRYILSCPIPARDGRSHVAKGMYQLITATAAPTTASRR